MKKLTFMQKIAIGSFSSPKAVIFYLLIAVSFSSAATSIMGGDIVWKCVGQDSFIIQLTLYRDCNGLVPGPAILPYSCNSSGTSLGVFNIPLPPPVDITPTCGSSCTRCSDSACTFPYGVEKYVYTKLVLLNNAGSCCEIKLTYAQCCRSAGITTGAANENYYTYAILNRCLNPCDNSPTFTNPPVAIICVGQDIMFCNGVSDLDMDMQSGGLLDSLAYEWTSPLKGDGVSTTFNSPYTYDKPIYFYGFPDETLDFPKGFHLDNRTSGLLFRPVKVDQCIMTMKISEYRRIGGIWTKIGELRREYTIIAIICPSNQPPLLSGPFYKEVFAGNTVTFQINTNDYDPQDILLISWNNAIPGATWTTNNKQMKHPTGILTWNTKKSDARPIPYEFTATVKDDACPVSGSQTRTYQILVKDSFSGLAEKSESAHISIYPNPINNRINIYSARETISSLTLFNLSGERIIEKENLKSDYEELDCGVLPPGMYLLKIKLNSGKILFRQVLLQ